MIYEDYEIELKKLREKHVKEIAALKKTYLDSNNPYKTGDLFTDYIGTVKIKSINYISCSISGKPEIYFIGTECKKNGELKKNEKERSAYLSNEVKK